MNTNKLFTVLLLTCLLFTGLVAGCDLPEANGELHGKWVAHGGLSLEFTTGRFTRITTGGEIEKGTYVTDGSNITFHRQGYSPETMQYSLNFPRLIVGGVTYYHDSPRMPDNMEGTWYGFFSLHSNLWPVAAILMGPMTPQKGNPWVMEGEYQITGSSRGEYTISARNMPNTGTYVMTSTHTFGGNLHVFIRNRLPVHLMELFDWEALEKSINDTEHWWFTPDEARKFFTDAAQRAGGDLAIEQQIMNAMYSFMSGVGGTSVYDYSLVKVNGPIYDFWGDEIEGDEILTFRTDYGEIITFVNANISEFVSFQYQNLVENCECKFKLTDRLVGCECVDLGVTNVF